MSNTALPLPDYDETGLSELRHDIRALSAAELDVLLEYERAHANRTPVLVVLTERRQQLDDGAEPSGGQPGAQSSRSADSQHGSPASPQSSAEPGEPLRHGLHNYGTRE